MIETHKLLAAHFSRVAGAARLRYSLDLREDEVSVLGSKAERAAAEDAAPKAMAKARAK